MRNCSACRSRSPNRATTPKRCRSIVQEVAQVVTEAANRAKEAVIGRDEIVAQAITATEKLVEEYFDVDDIERMLIADTDTIIIPSVRPTRARPDVPTIQPTNHEHRAMYTRLLCDTLNDWANKEYQVHGRTAVDARVGVGLVVLEKTQRGQLPAHLDAAIEDVLSVIIRLQQTAAKSYGTFELVRGLKVFDKNLLYITKPLGQRFWTNTAALNDADEIATTILTRSSAGESMIAGDPADWDDFFQQNLIPAVLSLVISAWDRMEKPEQTAHEDDISVKLYTALINGKDRNRHAFLIRYQDVEVDTDLAKVTGRKDIVFFPSTLTKRIYFCLEAKRLNALVSGVRRSLADAYVKEGMQRFVDGKYSRFIRHGGMLGYVLDGQVARAIKNVETNIQTHARELGMTLPGRFLPSSVRPDDPSAKETHHRRSHETALFRIHHLFMSG